MEPQQKIQSSFIPKKPVNTGAFSKHSGGLFPFISNVIFVIALISTVSMFVYAKYLESSISRMETELSDARTSLNPELINQLYRSDLRILSTKELIQKHISLSAFFELLQIKTLQNVSFNSFSYNAKESGTIGITLKGSARNYATLALQAKVIEQSSDFINPVFSDLNLNERGEVVFSFKSQLSPKAISYLDSYENPPLSKPIKPVMTDQVGIPAIPVSGAVSSSTPDSNSLNQ